MGNYIHKTILVDGHSLETIEEAHEIACRQMGELRVTPIMRSANDYSAFYVVACGGKEGGGIWTDDLHNLNDLKIMLGGLRARWYEVVTGEVEPEVSDSWEEWDEHG